MAEFQLVNTLTEKQILDLLALYQNEFWSNQRTHSDVVKMLSGSDLIFGIVDEHERLVAFARVLTDFVYRATLYDVIVKPTHRQQRLGARLMDAIFQHEQLTIVRTIFDRKAIRRIGCK